MFTNVGKKLQKVALILFWIGIILSIVLGILLMASGNVSVNTNFGYDYGAAPQRVSGIIPGIIVIIVGCLGSWIGALAIYAFGQLVDDNHAMRGKAVGTTEE